MAKAAGRLAVLSKNNVAIGGVRVTTISWSGETIDVTDADSDGVVELLGELASEQITLSVEGVTKDVVLRAAALAAGTSRKLTDITFKFADALSAADTISGDFVITSYEEGNPHDDASTFSAEFQSSGAWSIG